MNKSSFSVNTRVLVVDDDETARRLNLKVLKKLGFDHLNEAEDGAKALDIIRHELNYSVVEPYRSLGRYYHVLAKHI